MSQVVPQRIARCCHKNYLFIKLLNRKNKWRHLQPVEFPTIAGHRIGSLDATLTRRRFLLMQQLNEKGLTANFKSDTMGLCLHLMS